MKKLVSLIVLWVGVIAGFYSIAHAACANTDFWCYVSGPSQSLTTQAQLSSGGNLTLNGTITQSGTGSNSVAGATTFTGTNSYSGKTVWTPTSYGTALSTTSTITPTATYLLILSTGNSITMAGSGSNLSNPVIATATATSGQYLILGSTCPTGQSIVVVSSGAAAGLHLGSGTRQISQNSILTLIFDSTYHIWKEVSYTGE